jgi:ankyrin repeat protein
LLAAANGYERIVKQLLDAGSDINHTNDYDNSALLVASELGHLKVIDLLLSRGANTTQVNKLGNTALSMAKNEGHNKAVSLLDNFDTGETGLLKRLLNK